ncbi:MAG: CRISPR-associated protein Cas4 [Ktedonobacterales bacterium]
MTPDGLLEVTDLKQHDYCPRIPFYRFCLPRIRPITYGMQEGIRAHREETAREERRSLRVFGLTDGERVFDLLLRSEPLGIVARLDLAIRRADIPEAIVVDYKLSSGPAGSHFRLQLAAYALLLEEAWSLPVRRGFLYHIPQRQAEEIAITTALRKKVLHVRAAILASVQNERIPSPPSKRGKCVSCEFRRFCNDAI